MSVGPSARLGKGKLGPRNGAVDVDARAAVVNGKAIGIFLRWRASGAIGIVEAAVQIIRKQLVSHGIDGLQFAVVAPHIGNQHRDDIRSPCVLVSKVWVRFIVMRNVVQKDAVLIMVVAFFGESQPEWRPLMPE